MTGSLLLEIGCEELPPKALRGLAEAFAQHARSALEAAGFPCTSISEFATPRRLAVLAEGVPADQPDRQEQRRGPALAKAFDDDGEPTRAALGFARSCGVEVADLGRLKTEQGEWLAFEQTVPGRTIGDAVDEVFARALSALPIPKRMRWGSRDDEFVRPVHWVVALFEDEVLDCAPLGIPSGRVTRGHRVHAPDPITIETAAAYPATLEREGRVMPEFAARREHIRELVTAAASADGRKAVINDDLLDEVCALVEWPNVIQGAFDENFLELPEQALIASMQDHQKYFPVREEDGSLAARFITVSNIESSDPAVVRDGNERVIRPRLADAEFFFRTDQARPLAERLDGLRDMLFEKRLGSLHDKTERVVALSNTLAEACGADAAHTARAALLSRCDLLTDMVGEFPELQATMGGHYARLGGESAPVCAALSAFYRPRFAGDEIPDTAEGRCIAVADRLDSLVGIFGIGSAPTGDKDPFALRRAALGVLRILIEAGIELDLGAALTAACSGYPDGTLAADTPTEVLDFMLERLRVYYLDRGTPGDILTAVLRMQPRAPVEIVRRFDAVRHFRTLPASAALAAANKRIANILRKSENEAPGEWSAAVFAEPAEHALGDALATVAPEAERLFEAHDYAASLESLAQLREPIDRFFDDVMVMSDDAALRNNRLALLGHLRTLFTRVADLSELQADNG